MHKYPQGVLEITLANVSNCSYHALRLIEKEHFTSQCRDGGKGKTEFVHFELNEKYKLRTSFAGGGKGKTESSSSELN